MKSNIKNLNSMIIGAISIFLIIIGLAISSNQNKPTEKVEQHSTDISNKQFIKKIAPLAKEDQKNYKISASITIAQAALESNWGKSKLASKYNNLFGVKAGENPQKVSLYTDEYVNGKRVHVRQNFRVYNSWEDSVRAHTQLIVNGTSDQPNRYAQVRNTKNYRDAAKALQKGGYATDPEYAKKIIQLIEKHNLHKYDT